MYVLYYQLLTSPNMDVPDPYADFDVDHRDTIHLFGGLQLLRGHV